MARHSIAVLVSFVSLLIFASELPAANLKNLCRTKCSVGLVMCRGNTLGQNNACLTDCFNTSSSSNSSCIRQCTLPATGLIDPDCVRQCSSEANESYAECRLGCGSDSQCDGRFVDCLQGCNSRPQCTQNADCGANVCDNGICILACKTNAECQSRLHSPDGICLTTGSHKGTCALR
jgi:hypothetical protein